MSGEEERLLPLVEDHFLLGGDSPHRSGPTSELPGDGNADAAAQTDPPHRTERRRRLPRAWAREAQTLVKCAVPCIATSVLLYANKLVTVLFVGHLGARELAAATLAVMFINVFGFSLLAGMATATETLCSNAVTGAASMREAGLHLQRGVLLSALASLPLAAVWFASEPLLVWAGQDAALAALVGTYVRFSLPSLPAGAVFMNLVKFLQAQGYMKANLHVLLVALPVTVALQSVLVSRLGLSGAPLAAAAGDWLALVLLLLYTWRVNGHQAWGGFTWRVFDAQGCGRFLWYAAPGTLMVCAEWWAFELMALVAGWLGETQLAAQAVVLTTASLTYMVYNGIAIANANRIGNLLGAAAGSRARQSALTSLALAFLAAIVLGVVLAAVREQWAFVFTASPEVAKLVAQLLPVVALMQLADGVNSVGGGVLRGCGRQHAGAAINLVAYYLVGGPLCIAFYARGALSLTRMWASMTLALALTASVVVALIWRTDWERECVNARQRVRDEDASAVDGLIRRPLSRRSRTLSAILDAPRSHVSSAASLVSSAKQSDSDSASDGDPLDPDHLLQRGVSGGDFGDVAAEDGGESALHSNDAVPIARPARRTVRVGSFWNSPHYGAS